jgi:dTDP-glucose 4,6-dehydratase
VQLVLDRGTVGEVYNIGAGNEVPNRVLTETILDLTGHDASMIEHVEDRLGHDRRYSIATDKVEALGWSPQHDFRTALEDTVAWYRDNRWWWEPLRARG